MESYLIFVSAVLVLLFLGLAYYLFWNRKQFKNLQKQAFLDGRVSDERYYELKYKLEYITGFVTVAVIVLGALGYSSIKSISDGIKESLKETINKEIGSYENKMASSIGKSETASNGATEYINQLKKRSILRQDTYLVSGVIFQQFNTKGDPINKTYYFKDLKTITGEYLPAFQEAPIIIASSHASAYCYAYNVTKTSFKLGALANDYHGIDSTTYAMKMNLMISIVEK